MAFRWRDDYGPLIVVFGSFIPHQAKKTNKVGPPLTKLSGSAHASSLVASAISITIS